VIFVGRGLEGTTDTSAGYLGQLLFGQAAEPFYYVPLIAQLYLLSPFLVRLLERHSKAVLLAAALVQLTVQFARYPVALGWDVPAATWAARHLPGWFFPHMVFWFVFGTFTGFHLSSLRQWLSRWKSMLPWVTAALGLAGLLEWEVLLRLSGKEWLPPTLTVVDSLYACGCVLTYVAFSQTANWISRPLDLVGQRSYGVYLIHAPVLELFSRASYHMAPLLLSHQFVFQPLLIVAGVGVPLLLMMTVDRSRVRPCYSYLFG
jgi:peptidoglycan/LPS O-acetylase OafA/YrhL